MDVLANRASFDNMQKSYCDVEKNMRDKLVGSSYRIFTSPEFQTVKSTLEKIKEIGKVLDKNETSLPLITFNTYKFKFYQYHQKKKYF